MPDFPLRYTVGHRVFDQNATEDDWGNQAQFWFPAVPKPVYGWAAPGRMVDSEPKVAGHDRVVVEVELLVPPGFECKPQDRIILGFDPDMWSEEAEVPEHEVIGTVESYDHNPWDWNPGGVVNLRSTSG